MTLMVHVVRESGNSKTGVMAVTYVTRTSCPNGLNGTVRCPAWDICYTTGRIEGIAERYGTADPAVYTAAIMALADTIPQGGAFRAGVSGDFLAEDGTLNVPYVTAIGALHAARPDVTIIAYTHAWRGLTPDAFPFPVNASCDSAADVATARAAGWRTVRIADTAGTGEVQCLAQTKGMTCADCRLCAVPTRNATVTFAPHGIVAKGKRLAAYSA